MSKIDFSIVSTWDKGKPLAELNRLIDQRRRYIADDGATGVLYATAHTVLRSLKPLVKVAKVTVKTLRASYVFEDTGLVMGQRRTGEGRRIAFRPHHRYQGDYREDIRPVCLWGGGLPRQVVHVYRVTPRFKTRMKWAKNLNKGCWYLAAYNEGVARKYAEDTLMKRAIARYAGLAKSSIAAMRRALAQSAADSPPGDDDFAANAPDVVNTAMELAQVQLMKMGDASSLDVGSDLSYGRMALQDPAALDYAIAKAANSMAGYIRSKAVDVFNPEIATPFPEISRNGSMRR